MIFKNSEEKRNTAWRTVMTVSSVLIVIIAVFFALKKKSLIVVAGFACIGVFCVERILEML